MASVVRVVLFLVLLFTKTYLADLREVPVDSHILIRGDNYQENYVSGDGPNEVPLVEQASPKMMTDVVETDRRGDDPCEVMPVTEEPVSSTVPEMPTDPVVDPTPTPSAKPQVPLGPWIIVPYHYPAIGRPGPTHLIHGWYNPAWLSANVPASPSWRLNPSAFRWPFPPAAYQFQRPANWPQPQFRGTDPLRVYGYPLGLQNAPANLGVTGSSEEE